jgi:hypothetical protein
MLTLTQRSISLFQALKRAVASSGIEVIPIGIGLFMFQALKRAVASSGCCACSVA